MKRKIVITVLLIIGLSVLFVASKSIEFLTSAPSSEHKEVIFEISNGLAFHHIAHELEARGLVTNALKLGLFAKITGQATHVKVGEYQLFTDMRPAEVLKTITSGKSIAYALVVPEGYNIFEIREALNNIWAGRGDQFLKTVTDPKFIHELTGSKMTSLEGYLFPDTYSLTKFTSVETLARRMYDKFQEAIKEVSQNPKVKLPLDEQVIMASMIEKETGAPEERPMIASVFHNRRHKKMRLQSDPTIIYGMTIEAGGLIPKNITRKDITHPTPFNTYTVADLPAGPIANPGREALRAALNPIDSNYLFFVSRNDGTHLFSESLEKHNKAVAKFQLDPKQREGKSWRDLEKRRNQ
jgi:UPF0755 protein